MADFRECTYSKLQFYQHGFVVRIFKNSQIVSIDNEYFNVSLKIEWGILVELLISHYLGNCVHTINFSPAIMFCCRQSL